MQCACWNDLVCRPRTKHPARSHASPECSQQCRVCLLASQDSPATVVTKITRHGLYIIDLALYCITLLVTQYTVSRSKLPCQTSTVHLSAICCCVSSDKPLSISPLFPIPPLFLKFLELRRRTGTWLKMASLTTQQLSLPFGQGFYRVVAARFFPAGSIRSQGEPSLPLPYDSPKHPTFPCPHGAMHINLEDKQRTSHRAGQLGPGVL